MEVEDRLEIGSNTESFTVVLLMQLQEEGVLSLEGNLSQWLPEQAAIIRHGDEVSLYQLANDVSGIPDCTDSVMRPGKVMCQAACEPWLCMHMSRLLSACRASGS